MYMYINIKIKLSGIHKATHEITKYRVLSGRINQTELPLESFYFWNSLLYMACCTQCTYVYYCAYKLAAHTRLILLVPPLLNYSIFLVLFLSMLHWFQFYLLRFYIFVYIIRKHFHIVCVYYVLYNRAATIVFNLKTTWACCISCNLTLSVGFSCVSSTLIFCHLSKTDIFSFNNFVHSISQMFLNKYIWMFYIYFKQYIFIWKKW